MKGGDRFGRWALIDRMGSGGNGKVWRCRDSSGEVSAIKILTDNRDGERIGRFLNEIDFLMRHSGRRGIVPILDHDLTGAGRRKLWYVMPVGVSVRDVLGTDPDSAIVVQGIGDVAATLADLVDDGIYHRDLKPENLLEYGNRWCPSDFGLVKYPNSRPLTVHGRKLGPTNYMAPEMRESPDTADAGYADVYALAKTLWVLLAATNLPLPGQHRADEEMCRLAARISYHWASQLDLLIERCTANDPKHRLKMREMAGELNAMRVNDVNPDNPDTASLQKRIADVTEIHRRRALDRDRLFDRFDLACLRLIEQVGEPLLADLAERLPTFTPWVDPSGVAPPRVLTQVLRSLPTVSGPGRTSWGARLAAPGDVGVRVDLGVFLSPHDVEGRCTVAGSVAVNRYNEGRGLTEAIAENALGTTVDSAHFNQSLYEIRNRVFAAIPDTLKAVAEFLDAEPQ